MFDEKNHAINTFLTISLVYVPYDVGNENYLEGI